MIRMLTHTLRWLLTFLVLLPVRFYQLIIGPMLPQVCRFHPSCSNYFIQAVTKDGPVRGSLKGIWRVCRCNPWNPGGYDPP
jgi:putative membrane protein insertion efficiency factor